MTPWTAPESTFDIATNQMGHGAWTRSSISRVKPNSWAMLSAMDCTPWNMIEMPTTPGTRMVANADAPVAPPPPTDWPIFGNTNRKTKHRRKGWINVRSTNSRKVFRNTTRSRKMRPPSAARLAAVTERVGDVSIVTVLILLATPCQSG